MRRSQDENDSASDSSVKKPLQTMMRRKTTRAPQKSVSPNTSPRVRSPFIGKEINLQLVNIENSKPQAESVQRRPTILVTGRANTSKAGAFSPLLQSRTR